MSRCLVLTCIVLMLPGISPSFGQDHGVAASARNDRASVSRQFAEAELSIDDDRAPTEPGPLSLEAPTTQNANGDNGVKELRQDVDDFFNIRETRPDPDPGEWELELGTEWYTGSGGADLFLVQELSYGICRDMRIELEVEPLNLGDGGDQGNGDLGLSFLHRIVHEDGMMPSIAYWTDLRIPSGQGSSGVDAELHLGVSKNLSPRLQLNFNAFVATLNGGRSPEERQDRRSFQWGLGPGVDYAFTDQTVGVLNYLLQSSEEEGAGDENILELGLLQQLTKNQTLKFAIDVGLDGREETPDFGAKIQWEIEF
ncbi:MAG: hypothetical protein IT419_17790 [Planctomycetes bacterium]|nr:hypothetical protein [Planctomycetota bacterium]